jgi:hypothetical protein
MAMNVPLVMMVAPWMIFVEIVLAHRLFLLNALHHQVRQQKLPQCTPAPD